MRCIYGSEGKECTEREKRRGTKDRNTKNRIELVIFDLDGTVIDYGSCATVEAIVALFEDLGLAVTRQKIRTFMGMKKKDQLRCLMLDDDLSKQWRVIYGKPFSENDLEQMYGLFTPIQLTMLERHSLLIPGALEIQSHLHERGTKIAVTTGYSREMAEVLLYDIRRQGFSPDLAVNADDVPEGRPAPCMALNAAQQLGVCHPQNVVKIGDTSSDVAAGLNAGMWSVGITSTGNMLGLSRQEEWDLPEKERLRRLQGAWQALCAVDAHYVIENVVDAALIIGDIEDRLLRGHTPHIPEKNRIRYGNNRAWHPPHPIAS
ncbi:MAG: phosphonoacetaldehyde hydrolase [bacterium]|nr:phosphonoacetaldehyde hydrolase [bacterium]